MTTTGYSLTQPASSSPWAAPLADEPVQATIAVPSSKSLTNRKLVLAAVADAPSTLNSPLHSDDSARMVEALRTLGVGIEEVPGMQARLRTVPPVAAVTQQAAPPVPDDGAPRRPSRGRLWAVRRIAAQAGRRCPAAR